MFNKEILYTHQEANQHKTASNLYVPVGNSLQNLCAWTAPHYHQVLTFPHEAAVSNNVPKNTRNTGLMRSIYTHLKILSRFQNQNNFEKPYNK